MSIRASFRYPQRVSVCMLPVSASLPHVVYRHRCTAHATICFNSVNLECSLCCFRFCRQPALRYGISKACLLVVHFLCIRVLCIHMMAVTNSRLLMVLVRCVDLTVLRLQALCKCFRWIVCVLCLLSLVFAHALAWHTMLTSCMSTYSQTSGKPCLRPPSRQCMLCVCIVSEIWSP